jgi:hypothetical protein
MSKQFGLQNRLISGAGFAVVFAGASLVNVSPSMSFSTNPKPDEGEIEFSVRPVLPANPPVRQYDAASSSVTIKDGLLTPSRGYPLISEPGPIPPVQKKYGPISSPLSDTWTVGPAGKGTGSVTVRSIAYPSVAGIIWNGVSLDDVVDDDYAVRNASMGRASFKTTLNNWYSEFAFLNIGGGIYLDRVAKGSDAWVTGSLIGHFNDKAEKHTLEILFGFDGANRGREDFVTAFLDGVEKPSPSSVFYGNMAAGNDKFRTSGNLWIGHWFGLNRDQDVSVEGTFSCVAFNGYCAGRAGSVPVPVPSSVFGTLAAFAMGGAFMLKRQLKRAKRQAAINSDLVQ